MLIDDDEVNDKPRHRLVQMLNYCDKPFQIEPPIPGFPGITWSDPTHAAWHVVARNLGAQDDDCSCVYGLWWAKAQDWAVAQVGFQKAQDLHDKVLEETAAC